MTVTAAASSYVFYNLINYPKNIIICLNDMYLDMS
jgi:hypothetical protein